MKNNASRICAPDYRTWIEIDADVFHENIAQLQRAIQPQSQLGIVVKADAYGHGLELIGKLCQENNQVSWLFTAGLKEAVRLRQAGVTKPILVLAYIDDESSLFIEYNLTCSVTDLHTAQKLSRTAQHLKKTIAVHLKVDTGMSRFGFTPDDFLPALNHLVSLPGITIQGIFTHLSDTNNPDYQFTHEQLATFDSMVFQARHALPTELISHALPSGALHLKKNYTLVRVGTNAYGYWKSALQKERINRETPCELKPILTWKTRITSIKKIKAGQAIGYHRTYVTPEPLTIAILPVGYSDGYPRTLSHTGKVLIKGKPAPIVGIISMNSMVVDISQHAHVQVDDPVILCGDFPGITAQDLAQAAQSIQNEFLARLSPLIPRVCV